MRHRFKRLAIKTQRRPHPEAVDRVGQQQHLDIARLVAFELRAGFGLGGILGGEIVDGGLVFLQARDIVLEAHPAALGGLEAGDVIELVAALHVFIEALFQNRPEDLPDLLEILVVVLGRFLQLTDDLVGDRLADRRHLRIVLQHFARQVQGHVLAIDDATHEAQISGENLDIIGDIDALHIELLAAAAFGIVEIEGPLARHIEQHGIFMPALGAVVDGDRRIGIAAGDVAEKFLVLLRRDLGFWPRPDGVCGVDLARGFGVNAQADRMRDVIGIGPDDALDLPVLEKFQRVILQVQDDGRAARRVVHRRDGETARTIRRPHGGRRFARPARHDIDLSGDDEAGVEADAELTDQMQVTLRRLGFFDESLRAGLGDGAEIVDQLSGVHADAGVGDGQGFGRLVGGDGDGEFGGTLQQRRLGDRLIAQLVEGVRRVGDQFAQEHVAVGIDRVHHELQELGHLGLEFVSLAAGCRSGVFGLGLRHVALASKAGRMNYQPAISGVTVRRSRAQKQSGRTQQGPGRKLYSNASLTNL